MIAVAFNDPSKLDSMFKPSLEETVTRAATNPDEWDFDQWWNSAD